MARRLRRIAAALGPALVFGAALLAVAEWWVRQRHESTAELTGVTDWAEARYGHLTYFWDRFHPVYGWTNEPGYRGDARVPFQLTINEQGLRADREYDPRPPPGRTRIAIFGDSIVFGEEVDDDETIPVHLERRLDAAEVLNFGVHGFGLGQMALRLEHEGLGFHPDHVVIAVMLPWDVYRITESHFVHAKPFFRLHGSEIEIGNSPVRTTDRLPWIYRHSFAAAWIFSRTRTPRTEAGFDELLATAEHLLRRAGDQSERGDATLTVALIVVPGELAAAFRDPARRRTIEAMRRRLRGIDLDVLDAAEFLIEAYAREGGALAMPLGHWSSRGNCLIAERIAEHLAATREGVSRREPRPACPPAQPRRASTIRSSTSAFSSSRSAAASSVARTSASASSSAQRR